MPVSAFGTWPENDMLIAIRGIRAFCPCRPPGWLPESKSNPAPLTRIDVMMHADLIDQDDLLGQLRSLGFEVSSGATAEQACECAVRGLSEARAKALKGMVEQMYTSSATILPAVRQAIDKQLLPALMQFKQNSRA
ncbi:hypothetical protein PFWH6_5448 [Pseudomonas fluorescens WH6]|nr:hypothetical protein PFWH6_5448 [Pseudomonas fluorescens WH6]